MEAGAPRRGAETPRGVALTGHVPPVCPGERPPVARFQNDVLLPEVIVEKPPYQMKTTITEVPQISAMDQVPQEILLATAELPTEALPAVPSMVPPAKPGNDTCGGELTPCAGTSGTCPGEEPSVVVPVLPASLQIPEEQTRQLVVEEERATNHLDTVPAQEPGNEGFTYRHGHPGLLAHQLTSWPTHSTTTKDTYRPPHSVLRLRRGQREAMLEYTLYQKYRKEMLEKICTPQKPMELISTTHQDYCARGCQFMPPPTTQPHNYYTEQPRSFWLEQAHSLPGVTGIRSGDSPFRRNAAFSTPITEYLEQPLPCTPLGNWLTQ